MAVNIHITIIELNALHTKRQNLFQELDAVIHLLMEAKHWGLRKSRNDTSLNSRFKILDTLKVKIISFTYRRVIRSFPTRRSSDLGQYGTNPWRAILSWKNTPARCCLPGWDPTGKQHLAGVFFQDRKSTRLNSSHVAISYAVFCLIIKIIS